MAGKRASKSTAVSHEPVRKEPLLGIPEVMEMLDLGRDTVYKLIREEGLPTVKLGGSRKVVLSSLVTWIKQREQSSL